ncbi:MAG: hypothetical protein QM727_01630 [Niabella sp.]
MRKIILALACVMILFACKDKDVQVMGYEPIYGDPADLKEISLQAARAVESGGKIYVVGDMLYQVENGKGIHIMDISTPSKPEKAGFIKVPGCQEVSVKGDYIYTNNMSDLVIIRHEGNGVKLAKRLPDMFDRQQVPSRPPERGKFICPDKNKGIVIGWQKKMLTNPNCYY